jgi:hypothetical protein
MRAWAFHMRCICPSYSMMRFQKLGKLPVNVAAQYYYNLVAPNCGADWSLRVQIQFLFPK